MKLSEQHLKDRIVKSIAEDLQSLIGLSWAQEGVIEPRLVEVFLNTLGKTKTQMWLVWEHPNESFNPYQVVFDPHLETFGLAVRLWYVGPYGSFKKAIGSM